MSVIRPLRIFLVENHPDTLKVLTRYLAQRGHTVVAAQTMREALTSFPDAGCEVLISDIGLPDGDGWELLKTLRAEGKHSPRYAIAMSGYAMNSDRAMSAAVGFRHHRVKPFNFDDLDEMLQEATRALDDESVVEMDAATVGV